MLSSLLQFFMNWFFRNKTSLITVLFQTLIILFLMVLGFSHFRNVSEYLPSIFLICMFFMGQFFFIETHGRFQNQKTLQSLMLTGSSSTHLFTSLLLTCSLWMFLVEIILWILMHIFFQMSAIVFTVNFLLVLASGTISYVALGILFYGFHVFSKVEQTFIMMMFFPICIPLFLFFHQAVTTFFNPSITLNIGPMVGMNFLFVFSSMLLYEFVTEDLT